MRRATDPRILVFDSGFGGLSVLSALVETLPFADYVYLADDARFPYGDLPDDVLTEGLTLLLQQAIVDVAPDLIVIACNTASTVALSALRDAISLPIVGIVPAIKPAVHATSSGHFAVLATPGTIRRSYTGDLIRQFAEGCHVELVGCKGLAALAEDFVLHGHRNEAAVAAQIRPAFDSVDGDRVDVVVLGCTHYPLLLPVIEAVAPRPVLWIDPAPAVARRVMHLLEEEWQDCLAGARPGPAAQRQRLQFRSTAGIDDRLARAWEALHGPF